MNAPVRRLLPVIGPGAEQVEPPVRGAPALRAASTVFQQLDRAMSQALGADSNPLAETGAIANTTFLVAVVTGVLVLFWYGASVHQAYASMRALTGFPRLIRSLHRYSSDACMLFVLVHAIKLFCARRFGGARWLAWVTGVLLLGSLWLVGWLGYWLVWDERARQVALGSARLLDALPLFSDLLARSFAADATVNSLLFFVVFFLHMLIPLAMGIALWLHITRMSRPRFLTNLRMTGCVLASLVLVSLLAPADVAGPARMALEPGAFTLDAWYLAPIALTERLSGGLLWAVVLGAGVLVFSIPWLLVGARARVAVVSEPRCTACEKCFRDCPYDAIQMVARPSGDPAPTVARVDPSKCLGCGICAGSCDSAGIGLPWFDAIEQRHELDRKIAVAPTGSLLAVVCAESAGASLDVNANGACADLPGYTVLRAPCAGWLHPLTVERAVRRGVAGVLVVTCGPGSCTYREGGKWTADRMEGRRLPSLRTDKVAADRVRVLELFAVERARLVREARAFAENRAPSNRGAVARPLRALATAAVIAVFGLAIVGATEVVHATSSVARPMLVLSFRHAGTLADRCHELSAAEKARLPVHMRPKKICERRRPDVRVRVALDGRPLFQHSYSPSGVWGDGMSVGLERITVPAGDHDVRVEVGDTHDEHEWSQRTARRVHFEGGRNVVVVFEANSFVWQ